MLHRGNQRICIVVEATCETRKSTGVAKIDHVTNSEHSRLSKEEESRSSQGKVHTMTVADDWQTKVVSESDH